MLVIWCGVAAGCSTFGAGGVPSPDAALPSAPPCPAPALDARTWRDYSVLIPEGVFRIRLPAGWMHTPSHAGLYPRGADADGPYWSTDWARQNDYFQQWVQPAGSLTLKDAAPQYLEYLRAAGKNEHTVRTYGKALEAIAEAYPQADIFTLVHVKGSVSPLIESRRIRTSFIQRLPAAGRRYRHYLPLFPMAVEQLDLGEYDLVISISHCAAKVSRSVGS